MSSTALSSTRTSRWLRAWRSVPYPRLRLVCLPHAGGTAGFYRAWTAHLPADVELHAVAYPGRQDRLGEPCIERMDVMADRVAEVLGDLLSVGSPTPLALFGHSMGASIAYEVTRRLEAAGSGPRRLFVSGREAPQLALEREQRVRSDEDLIREVRSLGDVDRGVLDDPELRGLILPSLRSDYRLIDAYRPTAPPPVAAPITAYAGISDPGCPVDAARAWSTLTPRFRLRVFPGDHFFLVPAQAELVSDVVAALA